MRNLDETDLKIVRLLSEDARRPFSEIAERVGLSPPAVSDRVARLEEQGVIRRFTLDLDRTKLQSRVPIILGLDAQPEHVEHVYEELIELDGTEHVFLTFDGHISAHANAPNDDIASWLRGGISMGRVTAYEVTLLDKYEWAIDVTAAEFALTCPVCENSVGSDGVTVQLDDEIKAFCCPSCEKRYVEQYESFESAIDS